MYQALGAVPPDYLAQPIYGTGGRPSFTPQMAYIHPRVTGDGVRYFEWIGAARYTADQRSGAMHGKTFLLDAVYAGIDDTNVYGRLDFLEKLPDSDFELVVNLESWTRSEHRARASLRLEAIVKQRKICSWQISSGQNERAVAASGDAGEAMPIAVTTSSTVTPAIPPAKVALIRNFEFRVPLNALQISKAAVQVSPYIKEDAVKPNKIKLRFSLWQNRLPVDALPLEGWIDLDVVSDEELRTGVY